MRDTVLRITLVPILVLTLLAQAVCAEGVPLPTVGLGQLAGAVGNEALAQVTTNPPSPNLSGGASSQGGGQGGWQQLWGVNVDAAKSIGSSWSEFFKHPLQNLLPTLKNGAQASIKPFTDPKGTIQGLKDYFAQKGWVDGSAQTIYTVLNVVSVACIVAGAGAVIASVAGVPGAIAIGHMALEGLEIAGGVGLISGVTQWLFDEAQSGAPTAGTTIPSWVPFIGGKPLFHPTTHQQQVDLVKFDALNAGGSLLMLGFAKMGQGGGGGPAAYAGLLGSETGIVAGVTPVPAASPAAAPAAPGSDLSMKYEAVRRAASRGDLGSARHALAAYGAARAR